MSTSASPYLSSGVSPPLQGLRGLVLGVANEHSIAWGCAKALASRGARLVLTCLNEKAERVVAPLAESIDAPLLRCNVEHPGELESAVAGAAGRLGGLEFGIHSIAWAPADDLRGRVVDSTAEGFNQAMRVSCHSFAEMARLMEPHMQDGGALVTMSYIGANGAVPHYGVMGPVKAALESLVRYMAVELGPRNIRVHAVSPGPLPTRAASGLPEFDALMARAAALAPLGRLVTIDEVGRCTAFLVSPDATGLTGQTLYVDAGAHAVR